MSPGARLRALLHGGFFTIPGAFDPFTARIIESLGFPAIYLPGNALGLHLAAGQPLVTLTETVEAARRVLGAIESPLIVDAGAGFGAPANVHRAVRELERAGIAAIHLDDQPYPKRAAYHLGAGGLTPLDDAVERLSTAVAARRSDDFLIVARTDVWKVTSSLEQTVERCRAYAAAGVDALMVLNLAPEQLASVAAAAPGLPIIWFTTPSATPPTAELLRDAGFAASLYPFNTTGAIAEAVTAMWANFGILGVPKPLAQPMSRVAKGVQELIGMPAYWDIEAREAARRGGEQA